MKKLKQVVAVFTLGIALMTACNDAPPIIKDRYDSERSD